MECLLRIQKEKFLFSNTPPLVPYLLSNLHVNASLPACSDSRWRKLAVFQHLINGLNSPGGCSSFTIKFGQQKSCYWHHIEILTSFEGTTELVFLFVHVVASAGVGIGQERDVASIEGCHPYVELYTFQIWMRFYPIP